MASWRKDQRPLWNGSLEGVMDRHTGDSFVCLFSNVASSCKYFRLLYGLAQTVVRHGGEIEHNILRSDLRKLRAQS